MSATREHRETQDSEIGVGIAAFCGGLCAERGHHGYSLSSDYETADPPLYFGFGSNYQCCQRGCTICVNDCWDGNGFAKKSFWKSFQKVSTHVS